MNAAAPMNEGLQEFRERLEFASCSMEYEIPIEIQSAQNIIALFDGQTLENAILHFRMNAINEAYLNNHLWEIPKILNGERDPTPHAILV